MNHFLGPPWWISGKKSAGNAGAAEDEGLIPGLGRASGVGNGSPPQYSCLENSMDTGDCWATYSPWDCKESDTTEQLSI